MDKGDLPKPPENTQFVDGFLTNAFVQVKNLPPKNTIWNGIHSKPFTKIWNYLDKQLHQITGDAISEDEIIKAASKEDLVHEGEFGQSIKEDILYNLFQTPAFKDAFLG